MELYTTFLLILLISICWLFYIAIFRLYFHPLAKHPGPFLSRISPIPITGALLCGRLPFFIKACHDKFGPVVRVSPNELSFEDEAAWKDIYGSRPGHKNFHKDPIHVGSVEAVPGVTTITMADDVNHARQRRALSHAFSTKALLEQEYIVKAHTDVFSAKMREFSAKGEDVNVVDWFAYTTFDVIGDMALGEPFGCLHNENARFWIPLISDTIKAGAIEQATRRMATAGGPLHRLFLRCIPSSIRGTRRNHLAYSREKILKRINETKSEHKDFIYYLMNQQAAGNLDQNEIVVNGALFIVAGTETTAGFLAGLFNQLLLPRNHAALSTLISEIRTAFPSSESITYQELVKLPYLTAVIEEGLRIFPSAPIGFTRSVPEGGDTVSGCWIPGGTTVSVCMWAATHSTRNFADPYTFRPERWLGDRESATDKLGASNAFSLGPRGCIGRNLSYMEMRLIIAKLLWHNDVAMADRAVNKMWDPEGDHRHMSVYTNWMKPPLWVKLTPREGEGTKKG